MAYVLSSISGNLISAASAGYAPTNSGDVSAIASAYQVVSSTATQLYAGTAYVTSINDAPISASRAGNAANASLANSAWYDGTGRFISALPDSATVSAIASSYVESGVSSKQDTLSFAYNTADQISSINGSALGGMDEAAVSGIASAYAESAVSSKADASALSGYYTTANESGFITGVDLTDYATTAYVDSAVSSKADSSALSSYALSADVSGTVDLVSTQSANWGGSALALSAGLGVKFDKVGNTLVASTDETVLFEKTWNDQKWSETLSEPITNFERIRIEWSRGDGGLVAYTYPVSEHYVDKINNVSMMQGGDVDYPGGAIYRYFTIYKINGSSYVENYASYYQFGGTLTGWQTTNVWLHPIKIVGINRTAEA